VHGFVQLGSNSIRFSLTRKHADGPKIMPFAIGALFAALAGVFFVSGFNVEWLPLIVCIFILWISWGKVPELPIGNTRIGMFAGGLITTYASLFIGASGPLVSAWVGLQSKGRLKYTANFSACMSIQHTLKLAVFGVLGFYFFEWLILIATMILMGYLGTKIGLSILITIPQESFKLIFKIILSLLAIRLL